VTERKTEYEVETLPTVSSIIRPVATPEQALQAWNEYQALKQKLAGPGDFAKIQGRDWPTKQYANKLTRFFNLSVEIRERWREDHDDGTFTWHIISRAIAPNGVYRDGDGHCHSGERKFSHIQHDVFATAVTRSKNRAVLELVGFGEVSAEEIEDGGKPEVKNGGHWIDNPKMRRRFWQWARDELALSDTDVYQLMGIEHIHDFKGTAQEFKDALLAAVDKATQAPQEA